jgi:hypothetical protein
MNAQQPDRDYGEPPHVFVSYSHDSEEHKSLVREFCTVLRRDEGIDVQLDQWADDGRRDWSAWATAQIRDADFILAIASPDYQRRAEGLAAPHEGRGGQYEAAMLRDQLTRNLTEQVGRILPVVLPGRGIEEIPAFLFPYSATHYIIRELTHEGVAELVGAMVGVARHPRPERGTFVGNPYAQLHATLQAAENKTRPESRRVGDVYQNSGTVHIGDNVGHNKIHYGPVQR